MQTMFMDILQLFESIYIYLCKNISFYVKISLIILPDTSVKRKRLP